MSTETAETSSLIATRISSPSQTLQFSFYDTCTYMTESSLASSFVTQSLRPTPLQLKMEKQHFNNLTVLRVLHPTTLHKRFIFISSRKGKCSHTDFQLITQIQMGLIKCRNMILIPYLDHQHTSVNSC